MITEELWTMLCFFYYVYVILYLYQWNHIDLNYEFDPKKVSLPYFHVM